MTTQASTDEGYADDAPLMALFGAPAKTRMVSVFVAEKGRDLTVSDIARQAGLSRTTVYDHIDDLLALEVIEESRTSSAGHSTRYQLNGDSDIGELCYKLEGVTLRKLLENEGHM